MVTVSLSESEYRELYEIQHRLTREDPDLAREMRRIASRPAVVPGSRGAVLMVSAGLLLLLLGAVLHSQSALLVGLVTMFLFPAPIVVAERRRSRDHE
jgi:hypothetical protein